MRWLGAVLAGGASSRMETDKAFIEIAGVPMVRRAADALATAGAERVVIAGGDAKRIAELGLECLSDAYEGEGPLAGVLTALSALTTLADDNDAPAAAVTLPCDVINPDADSVRQIVQHLDASEPSVDAVIPVGGGTPQWLNAAWRRSCLTPLSDAFADGIRAPKEAVRHLRTVTVEIAGTAWFRDADTPEDLPTASRSRP